MHIGYGVRAAMAVKRMNAQDVADKSGMTRQSVHYWLRQEDWKYKEMERIATAIGVTVDDIIDFAKKA